MRDVSLRRTIPTGAVLSGHSAGSATRSRLSSNGSAGTRSRTARAAPRFSSSGDRTQRQRSGPGAAVPRKPTAGADSSCCPPPPPPTPSASLRFAPRPARSPAAPTGRPAPPAPAARPAQRPLPGPPPASTPRGAGRWRRGGAGSEA